MVYKRQLDFKHGCPSGYDTSKLLSDDLKNELYYDGFQKMLYHYSHQNPRTFVRGFFVLVICLGWRASPPAPQGRIPYPPAEPCHYCKRSGSMTSIDSCGAGGSRFSAIDTATAPVLHRNRGCTILWQYRIILSADTASEVRQLLSQKRR